MTYNVDVLKKIKSKGYWKIVITPNTYKKDKLSLSKCKEIVEKSKIKRGWYYPYISEVGDTLGIGFNLNNCFTNSIDWEYHTGDLENVYQRSICTFFGIA